VLLIADENCDPQITQALRDAGHDVRAAGETDRGAANERVIAIALSENRVLLTEDKDFGGLVYKRLQPSPGVVLIRRFPASSPAKADAVLNTVSALGDALAERFVVIEPGRVRPGGRPRG